ncbi:MAG: carboxymuconolactone decarboxylase family protein [Acidiferrobacteraceae bacterium]
MPISHARLERTDFRRIAPAAEAAILALGQVLEESGIEQGLLELIKLRASQINGCSFCTQYHLNIARKLDIPRRKLDLIAVWRDAGVFSDRECAALAWTEMVTDVARQGVPDEAYAIVLQQFSEAELVFLTTAVGVINLWNRIAVAFRFSPPLPKQPGAGGAV